MGKEQLAAPNSSTNPDLGSTNRKRIGAGCGGGGMGFEAGGAENLF